MGKHIKIDGEFEIPEVMIQHIQSFLTAKEAAQSTILSKSWNKAWFTRPNLDFDQRDFKKESRYDEFMELVKQTIKRYEESNLKIDSFGLCITGRRLCVDYDLFAKDLMLKASKIGAINLNFISSHRHPNFFLPSEVFGAENLVGLSVDGCDIKIGKDQKIRCSRLESLSLSRLEIWETDMMSNILSGCPLIKTLSLSSVYTFKDQFVEGFVIDGPIKLHKLRCLVLVAVEIETLFFKDFSSKFPNLKDLTINNCFFEVEIRISSHSLQGLIFLRSELRIKFNVPSIRRFTFENSYIPSLSFESTSREWESHVSIAHYSFTSLWFTMLNEYLTALSPSKIYLTVLINRYDFITYNAAEDIIKGLPKHEVESLTLSMAFLPSSSCFVLFHSLFMICRPKFVTLSIFPEERDCNFLSKILLREMNGECSIPDGYMSKLEYLEEVNVKIFEESMAKWRSLPLKSFLDGSTELTDNQKVRFKFKWRPSGTDLFSNWGHKINGTVV